MIDYKRGIEVKPTRVDWKNDIIKHYERPVWMAADIRDKNFAIGSFYRSQDMTTMQRI